MALPEPSAALADWRESSLIAPWLLRLRWLAVAGQALGIAALAWVAPDPSATLVLTPVALLTAATNLLLYLAFRRGYATSDPLIASVLLFDVAVLTAALAATGGPENPFAILYIVYIAMALAIGTNSWSWSIVAAVVFGYAAQFLVHAESHLWHQSFESALSSEPIQLHMLGMWAATGIVAVVVTYYVREILRDAALHRTSLRGAERRLERTQHLASLTTLAAGAAHELSSPLATVAVLARELERSADAGDASGVRADAGTIRDEVDRCREILDRMSSEVTRQLEHADAPATAADFEALLRVELGDAAGRVAWSGDVGDLQGTNLHQLTQLLLPLIRNALDASGSEERVDVSLERADATLRIQVSDRGEGMSIDTLDRAVEPFFTTKAPGEGMGLGLHLVRIVSEAMGGSLSLDSHRGSGTRATLELPVVARREPEGRA